ncbi:MAG: efflux RND transporter periplasmic adaptor subunit [Nitrosomonas sp.]|nr:efflux RND transporter periplasmic adaptor subunit [Nitrosomonas sp.]
MRQIDRCIAFVCHFWLPSMAFILVLLLTGCLNNHSGQDQALKNPDALPVTVMEVMPTSAPRIIETVGQTEGAKEVEVRPRVGGILLKHLYEEGVSVQADQPLFLIDPVPFRIALQRAKAQLSEQQARVADAKREVTRMRRLLAENFVSQRMFDTAATTLAVEEAALKNIFETVKQAKLDLSYTTVVAPVAGVSGRARFSEGSLVEAQNSLLTTIQQITPIWVRFSLSDHELIKLGGRLTDQTVTAIKLVLPDGSAYPLAGRINFTASSIDPMLGTQQLRAVFANPDKRLLPGQFVRVHVQTGEYNDIFLVPQPAVLAEDTGKYVYLANEQNEAVIQPVQAGEWSGKDWIILDGLKRGDRVIIDNLIRLRPDIKIDPQLSNIGKPIN